MDAVFTKNIKEQLFLNGSVIIPDIGKLYTVKKMALLDAVRGQIDPPQADIFLDTNSKINDGVLVDAISKSEGISTTEAQKLTDEQTNSMLSALNKYELIALEGFGRFYNDGMGKIHFLQDAINLNAESYGLPTLKFEPISRTEKVVSPEMTSIKETIKPETVIAPVTTQTYQYMNEHNTVPEIEPILNIWGIEKNLFKRILTIAAVTLAFLALLFSQINRINKSKVVISAPSVSSDTLNTITSSAYIGDTMTHATDASGIVAETKPTKEKAKPAKEAEKVVSSSKEKTATIIIGAFGNEKNIAKLESWISNKGYELYSKKRGNLTIVGAKVGYNSSDELKSLVSSFRSKYGKEVFIL